MTLHFDDVLPGSDFLFPTDVPERRQRSIDVLDVLFAQHAVDLLVDELPERISQGEIAIVAWLKRFAAKADHIDVKYDLDRVARMFISAGYGQCDGAANLSPAKNMVGEAVGCLLDGHNVYPYVTDRC
jgi:hypothetical protein